MAGVRSSSPITARCTAPCPTNAATLTPKPARVEALQIFAEALPAHVDLTVIGVADGAASGVPGAGDGRAAMAALSDDFGGDALMHLALRPAVDQQREVGVRVQVDESGAYGESVQLDVFGRLQFGQVADACNLAVANSDVGPERLAARSVDDFSTGKNCVDHDGSLPLLLVAEHDEGRVWSEGYPNTAGALPRMLRYCRDRPRKAVGGRSDSRCETRFQSEDRWIGSFSQCRHPGSTCDRHRVGTVEAFRLPRVRCATDGAGVGLTDRGSD